jgi:hypothetical protein
MNGAAPTDPASAPGGVAASAAAASAAHAPEVPERAGSPANNPDGPEATDAGVPLIPSPDQESLTESPAAAHTDAAPVPAPGGKATPSVDQLSAVASSIHAWLSPPRVRLIVTGAMLLLIDGLFLTNSVWTLPLGIVAALMVVIGWVGGRLDGRFTVEWGKTGTQLEFRARIAAPPPARASLSPAASLPRALDMRQPTPEDAGIIEAEAHTVEIDLAELEALIAAAETAEAQDVRTDAATRAVHKLHAARGGERSSDDLR